MRHAHACACHHRASRASSTFPFRPRAIGTRVLRRRRRSFARSIARTRCGVGDGDGDGGDGGGDGRLHRAPRAMYVTHTHARIITAHGARHQRFPFPCAIGTRALRCGGGARSLARSITRTQSVAVAMAVAAEVGYIARRLCHARHMCHSSRARAPRHHRASSTFPFRALPRARSVRMRCGGGGARSLALLRARFGGGGGGGGTPCVTRVRVTHVRITRFVCHARACTCHHRASRASSTCPFRPRAIGTRVLRRRRRSLARSIVRTRYGVGDGDGGGGGGGGRLHRAPRAMYVTRAHARVITAHGTRHQRFPSPRAIGTRALRCGGGARSLARSRARGAWQWRWRWRWRSVNPRVIRVMCVTCAIRLARVRRVITARHQRFPSELSLARDRHARAAAAVALARSLYRARGVAVAVAVAVDYDARQSWHAHHAVHALLTHTPRHRRASRASSPFPVPPTIGTRAAAVAALARSLSIARAVWRWM